MPALEIIGVPQSTFVRVVRMACCEKGVAYTLLPERPHTPAVDAINPFGRVPVMRHGGFTLFESKAIATYIDKAFPGPALFPDDAKTLGLIEQWVSVINTAIAPTFMTYLKCHFFPKTNDGSTDTAGIQAIMPELAGRLELLEKSVGAGGHLVGHAFTYADMNLLPWIVWLRELPESGAMISELPGLKAYFADHSTRASFKDTVPPPMPPR